MLKLLNAFTANPTPATAKRLVTHANRHPMALCMVTPEDIQTLARASTMLESAA